THQERHENTAEPAAPAHDPTTEPAPGADSRTPLPGNDGPGSLPAELAHHPAPVAARPATDPTVEALHGNDMGHLDESTPFLSPEEDVISVEPMPARRPRSMEELLMDTADESAKILAWAEAANVGDLTIEQIHAEIYRIARSYLKVPTMPLFDRTRELRDRIV